MVKKLDMFTHSEKLEKDQDCERQTDKMAMAYMYIMLAQRHVLKIINNSKEKPFQPIKHMALTKTN